MLSNWWIQDAFKELGTNWEPSEELLCALERFVCALYGEKDCTSVDDVRYRLFCRDLRNEDGIPPTQDSLRLHSRRANYQAAIFRRSLSQQINAPSADEHGWTLTDGKLEVKWMTMPALPHDVLHMVTCKCSKSGCTSQSRCGCQEAGLVLHRAL